MCSIVPAHSDPAPRDTRDTAITAAGPRRSCRAIPGVPSARLDLVSPKFVSIIAAALAATTIAVFSGFLGGLLGSFGTVAAAGFVSLITGAAAAGYERAIKRGHELARKRRSAGPLAPAESLKVYGRPRHPGQLRRLALLGAIAAAIVAVTSYGVITAIEAIAGKPVSAIVQNKPGRGFTFGGSVQPAHAGSPSPAPSPSASAGTPAPSRTTISPTPTLTPSPTATPTSASPSATPSPAGRTHSPITTTPR